MVLTYTRKRCMLNLLPISPLLIPTRALVSLLQCLPRLLPSSVLPSPTRNLVSL